MTTATTERIEYTDAFSANNSSNIDSVLYNSISNNLYVKFHSGETIYQYGGVPYSVFVDFRNANSCGQFYVNEIKGEYARGIQTDDYALKRVYVDTAGSAPVVASDENVWSVSLTITGSTESFVDSVRTVNELLEALADNGYDYTLTGANLSS